MQYIVTCRSLEKPKECLRMIGNRRWIQLTLSMFTKEFFMSSILYRQTAGTQQTQSGAWTPIPGLQFTLPPHSSGITNALIILNVPNPYATGSDFTGGMFGIS